MNHAFEYQPRVTAVGTDGAYYHIGPPGEDWKKSAGGPVNIAAGPLGVFCVGANNSVWFLNGGSNPDGGIWQPLEGSLKNITVGKVIF